MQLHCTILYKGKSKKKGQKLDDEVQKCGVSGEGGRNMQQSWRHFFGGYSSRGRGRGTTIIPFLCHLAGVTVLLTFLIPPFPP